MHKECIITIGVIKHDFQDDERLIDSRMMLNGGPLTEMGSCPGGAAASNQKRKKQQ
jgi:hypothetical protein